MCVAKGNIVLLLILKERCGPLDNAWDFCMVGSGSNPLASARSPLLTIVLIEALEFFTLTCILICKYTQKSTENNLWHLPWGPHVCTLYQIMYSLTSFREWSVPDSGSPHIIYSRDMLPVLEDFHYTQPTD